MVLPIEENWSVYSDRSTDLDHLLVIILQVALVAVTSTIGVDVDVSELVTMVVVDDVAVTDSLGVG